MGREEPEVKYKLLDRKWIDKLKEYKNLNSTPVNAGCPKSLYKKVLKCLRKKNVLYKGVENTGESSERVKIHRPSVRPLTEESPTVRSVILTIKTTRVQNDALKALNIVKPELYRDTILVIFHQVGDSNKAIDVQRVTYVHDGIKATIHVPFMRKKKGCFKSCVCKSLSTCCCSVK